LKSPKRNDWRARIFSNSRLAMDMNFYDSRSWLLI
jgi:hypothetical protein